MSIKVEIDEASGFCFGVVTAIDKAEEALAASPGHLYCLGDIVHNNDEVRRLEQKGMVTITHDDLSHLNSGDRVLLRAHGEPPATYATARAAGIALIDATCPVVLRLQQRIRNSWEKGRHSARQIVIYGKKGHAEVNGLVGQTEGKAIVVQSPDELEGKVDFTRPIDLYSQTTMSLSGFKQLIAAISERMAPGVTFESHDTICRQVANRVENLRAFAAAHSLVLFVSGLKSSNGRFLHGECLSVNPSTYLISGAGDIDPEWLHGKQSIGICGATSTPRWLMEQVRDKVMQLINDAN